MPPRTWRAALALTVAVSVLVTARTAAAAPRSVTVLDAVDVTAPPLTQVEGYGAIWALSETDWFGAPVDYTELTKIDERTGAVVGTVNLGYDAVAANDYPSGFLAAGAGAVWVIDYNKNQLIEIDPATAKVVRRVATGTSPAGVTVADGSVWVAHEHVAQVWRYDATTLRVLARITAGDTTDYYSGLGVASVGEGAVWVGDNQDGAVVRIDPATNTATSVDVGDAPPCGPLVFVPGGFWLDGSLCGNSVYHYDDATRSITAEVDLPHCLYPITYGHGALYLTYARKQNPHTGECAQDRLAEYDPTTGALLAQRSAPATGSLTTVPDGFWFGDVRAVPSATAPEYHVAGF